ncbi:hypothetical protein TrVGV298_007035 [Trichoderma virens]|nr:hypothetical protein TrVGV298_007035 [Trichoderma virens]
MRMPRTYSLNKTTADIFIDDTTPEFQNGNTITSLTDGAVSDVTDDDTITDLIDEAIPVLGSPVDVESLDDRLCEMATNMRKLGEACDYRMQTTELIQNEQQRQIDELKESLIDVTSGPYPKLVAEAVKPGPTGLEWKDIEKDFRSKFGCTPERTVQSLQRRLYRMNQHIPPLR